MKTLNPNFEILNNLKFQISNVQSLEFRTSAAHLELEVTERSA